MEILYLLIPLALVLVAIIIVVFLWAIRSGQFDDLEGPAHRILMDDDEPPVDRVAKENGSPRGKQRRH
ncbi:MAG TPA: cbb3-type cytochrome oxidase assembly protein CcoS [Acidiferrobacterales bacterium]